MRLALKRKVDDKQKESYNPQYTDMPLEYLKDEYPEVYNEIIRKYKAVDSYVFMRNM
ncbi:hypothetical protein [Acidianus manzaensis]|uniref:hypothetical protein n=1 Tax=Acidianus manzaensis TaxID=282676 RepID=UPI00164EEC8F|nr:hypothetical protein [Acidianus manzaensis]